MNGTMRLVAALLVVVFGATQAAAAVPQGGTIAGTARDAANGVMSGVKVQLRNVDTGQLIGTTQSAANGSFSFTGLAGGHYIVEIVDAAGKIVGVSSSLTLAAGATITGLTVGASAAGAAALAAGGFGSFFTSTAGILTGIAVVGGVAAGVVIANDASGSR